MTPPHTNNFHSAIAAHVAATDALYAAAVAYVEGEVRLLSKRFPGRRIEWESGMGLSRLKISRRRPVTYGDYDERHYFVIGSAWSSRGVIRQPAFMKELAELEDETRLNGLGDAVFVYQNGELVE